MRYCRRIRRLKRMSQITTEIHAEISQVLHHNHIIFCCQFTDNSQFFLFQTNPCRIIRIGVYDSSNFARAQHAFQFIMQSSPPISINIKFFPLHPYNAKLGFLNRKSGIDKQYFIFSGNALRTSNKRTKRTCNRTRSRHTGTRRNFYIHKCLYKTRSFIL